VTPGFLYLSNYGGGGDGREGRVYDERDKHSVS